MKRISLRDHSVADRNRTRMTRIGRIFADSISVLNRVSTDGSGRSAKPVISASIRPIRPIRVLFPAAARGIKCGRSAGGPAPVTARKSEEGWALLALILALTIMSIMMVGIMPNVQLEVRRDKEEEMMFRGQEMAEGIARYYNLGRAGPIGLAVPPPYGYLTDLKKLSEGVTLGATEIKFVRGSAMTDPMVNKDWVPVRARDPRLMPMLQAYAAATLTTIPPSYMALAVAPIKTHLLTDNSGNRIGASGNSQIGATSGGNSQIGAPPSTGDAGQSGSPGNGGVNGATGQNRPATPRVGAPGGQKTDGDDDDDDDDDDTGDPLAHLLKNEPNNLPIVGVAPNMKGPCVHPIYGITRYEQWVFIYLPPANLPALVQPGQPGQPGNGQGPLRGPRPPQISQ